jgi:hypothetical protein
VKHVEMGLRSSASSTARADNMLASNSSPSFLGSTTQASTFAQKAIMNHIIVITRASRIYPTLPYTRSHKHIFRRKEKERIKQYNPATT